LVLLLAVTPAFADPAVWAARGPNATVYLLGSVHLLRPGTVWEGPAVRRAFDEARECWFEAVQADDPAAMQAVIMSTGLDPAHRLSDLLPPNRRTQLDRLAAEAGVGQAMQAMRPWLAAVVLTGLPLLKAGFDPALGVDTVLQAQAKAAGKRVAGVETMDQQMRLMAGLPQGLAVKFLLSAMDDAVKGPALIDEMIRGWQSADTEALARTLSGQLRREAPDLYRIIFAERNETFARAAKSFLAGDKTVLLVIGAGHLAGPDNVRELLARRGVKMERVLD
ncbi:MAG: TraB/GumN family protein, partial [Janthinobacterium lividum]